ncbi:hypothetical protein [Halomonas caseinilytica]|uniref:hypothetical protein n=1 Tax=Halomonas caseinilytica TaxID=438744 RepID=UPI0008485E9B|nr:hypothetical protein [Halomonas caseinilytica]
MSERADKDLALRERFKELQQAADDSEAERQACKDRIAALEEKVEALICDLRDQEGSTDMRIGDLECRMEDLAQKMPGT